MSRSSFLSQGIRCGRIKGIEIWLHWSLLLVILYHLHGTWMALGARPLVALGSFGCYALALWGSILLHEFGHCYAAYRMGGGADRVVLWPLGGLALCDAPKLPRAQFWVAAGGPLVNVAIVALVLLGDLVVYLVAPAPPTEISWTRVFLSAFVESLYSINVFLLVLNLLPIWPLDGGQITRAVLWGRFQSLGRASLTMIWVSRVAIVVALLLSFVPPLSHYVGGMMIFFLLYCFFQTEHLKARLQDDEEDYVFGYDFSRGYTSLERTVSARAPAPPKRPGFFERRRLKREQRRREQLAELQRELDSILDKISAQGMESLTRAERKLLDRASRELGQKDKFAR